MSADRPPFHLAIAVDDLGAARAFYGGVLGCREGRSAPRWIDYDFFGHQLSVHLAEETGDRAANPVDGDSVPIPHFGAVLSWEAWHDAVALLGGAGVAFALGPRVRFQGQVGEQATLFVRDPAGNAIELKAFKDPARLFQSEESTA